MFRYLARVLIRRLHDRGLVQHQWREAELFVPEWGHVDFVWCDGCGLFTTEEQTLDHESE